MAPTADGNIAPPGPVSRPQVPTTRSGAGADGFGNSMR
jgi:hypothetical protein